MNLDPNINNEGNAMHNNNYSPTIVDHHERDPAHKGETVCNRYGKLYASTARNATIDLPETAIEP